VGAGARAAFEAVSRMLADGRLGIADLVERLDPATLELFQRPRDCELAISDRARASLAALAALGAARARSPRGEAAVPVLTPQGAVSHEIVTLRLLLLGFEPFAAIEVFDWVEASADTRVEIGRAPDVRAAAPFLIGSDYDVALVDLSSGGAGRIEELASSELAEAAIPVLFLIDEKDEPVFLHLGLRSYLVRSQVTSQLLVRTLRFTVERHALERELARVRANARFHATRDRMTALPNRHHFREELDRALAHARRIGSQVAVLFLDLDRFKQINDTFGHQVGDALITTMAERLRAIVRKADVVARVGGDEFLLMLQGDDLAFAPAMVATKILELIAQPFRVADEELSISASIGIAVHPRDGEDPDALVRNADAAMYQAKASGRNSYQFYSQSMHVMARRRLTLESHLRRAIERRELALHFQPRIDAASGRVVAAEALLRWTDESLGAVSPAEFIPVAEEAGLIVPLGEWVLREACAEQRRWSEAGFGDVRVSVNLSGFQIRRDALREEVVRALWDAGVEPDMLEVEITESALIENQDIAAGVLMELVEMGVRVALDDFGTGFSSLSYLKRFPVHAIKIDQSFVRDVLVDGDDASIIEAILQVGERLGLRVVAEGVELEGQRAFLAARGCGEMQGFLFSPALPAPQLLEFLRARAADR